MFRKTFAMESTNEMKEGHRSLVKKYSQFFDLLAGQYLCEILHTSPIVKTNKNVVKSDRF